MREIIEFLEEREQKCSSSPHAHEQGEKHRSSGDTEPGNRLAARNHRPSALSGVLKRSWGPSHQCIVFSTPPKGGVACRSFLLGGIGIEGSDARPCGTVRNFRIITDIKRVGNVRILLGTQIDGNNIFYWKIRKIKTKCALMEYKRIL